jgi:hypothetical protein
MAGITTSRGTITAQSNEVEMGCGNMSWGDIASISFDANMVPIQAETGTYDMTKPIWMLKEMERVDLQTISYATTKYLCESESA